jgi:cell filamentation protein
VGDPYCYKGTDVLINKLGIRDNETLQKAEVDYSCNAIHELILSPLAGEYDFAHLCEFHRHIFQDVYDWAGTPRTMSMVKEEPVLGGLSVLYSEPDKIIRDAEVVLDGMRQAEWGKLSIDKQAETLAGHLAELWKVHPFREGNTRTTITFICQYVESAGIAIDRKLFQDNSQYMRNALVAAAAIFPEGDFRKPVYLYKIVKDSLERGTR